MAIPKASLVDRINKIRKAELDKALFDKYGEQGFDLENMNADRRRWHDRVVAGYAPITADDILEVKPKKEGEVKDKIGVTTRDGRKYYFD